MLRPGARDPFALSAEEALLLRVADGASVDADEAAALGARVRWDPFFDLVNRVAGWGPTWRVLARVPTLPPEVRARLASGAAISDLRLDAVRRLSERTVARLAADGAEVLLLKGVALAAAVYAQPGDRNMADLDYVVRPGQLEACARAAQAAGWEGGDSARAALRYAEHHHLPPMRDGRGLEIKLELHSDVLPPGHPLQFSAGVMRGRARVRPYGASTVLVPSAEHLMVHACLHLGWSHEMRVGAWRTFQDVAALARHADFAWERFVAEASGRTLRTTCFWVLRMARELSRVAIPEEVLQALRPRLGARRERAAVRHFASQLVPGRDENPSERVARVVWNLAIQPGRSGHGDARPWAYSDRWPGEAPAGAGGDRWWRHASGVARAWAHVRRITR